MAVAVTAEAETAVEVLEVVAQAVGGWEEWVRRRSWGGDGGVGTVAGKGGWGWWRWRWWRR